ncbi:MAG: hypothetical protein ACRD5K_10470 [Candidatus Acidiferrales bacterium]
MKCIALGVLLSLAATARSQQQPPKLLFRSVQCLAAKNFLPTSKAPNLSFGYVLDEKSYLNEKVVYIIGYAAPARSDGKAYAVFVAQHGGHDVFNIQNDTSFVLSKDAPSGISFVTPPLGGTWTHTHLASAIAEIEKRPRFAIPVKDLSRGVESAACEAYTDPQPKRDHR